jgi:hypothetical protein
MDRETLEKMAAWIKTIKEGAEALKNNSAEIPAVERNSERILASVRMLEINVTDLLE